MIFDVKKPFFLLKNVPFSDRDIRGQRRNYSVFLGIILKDSPQTIAYTVDLLSGIQGIELTSFVFLLKAVF